MNDRTRGRLKFAALVLATWIAIFVFAAQYDPPAQMVVSMLGGFSSGMAAASFALARGWIMKER